MLSYFVSSRRQRRKKNPEPVTATSETGPDSNTNLEFATVAAGLDTTVPKGQDLVAPVASGLFTTAQNGQISDLSRSLMPGSFGDQGNTLSQGVEDERPFSTENPFQR